MTFRIPTGPAASRHLEHWVCGADANPYLAAAAVLAGMHSGIANGIDPGPPTTGNAYDQVARTLSLNWHRAIEDFEGLGFVRDYFGPDFRRVFAAVKRHELDWFHGQVTSLDHDLYMRTM